MTFNGNLCYNTFVIVIYVYVDYYLNYCIVRPVACRILNYQEIIVLFERTIFQVENKSKLLVILV